MQDPLSIDLVLRALANQRRLQILGWLKKPRAHFPRQLDGDLVKDGVCGVLIRRNSPSPSRQRASISRFFRRWG